MEKLNIAELLKDCPSGMELDCLLWDNVTFERVADDGIWIKHIDSKSNEHSLYVYNDGSFPIHNLSSLRTKCVIFPKGKTTWEGFQRPFKDENKNHLWTIQDAKDGDVISCDDGWTCIFKRIHGIWYSSYCFITNDGDFHTGYEEHAVDSTINGNVHLAINEQCNLLFQKIKEAGYKWNPETKTLENLKKDKFDITALKPFDKVLVRGSDVGFWMAHLFSFYDTNCITIDPYKCISQHNGGYAQCIPYEGNEYLLGTTKECDEYYKTW